MGRWVACPIEKMIMIPNSIKPRVLLSLFSVSARTPRCNRPEKRCSLVIPSHSTMQETERRKLHSMCRHVPPTGIMFRDQEACCGFMFTCQPALLQHPTENPKEPSNTDSAEKSRLMLFSRPKDGTSPLE